MGQAGGAVVAVCFATALRGIQSVFGCGNDLCNIDLLGWSGMTAPVCAFIAKSIMAVTANRPLVVSLMVWLPVWAFLLVEGIV